jgi:hypothetical protein
MIIRIGFEGYAWANASVAIAMEKAEAANAVVCIAAATADANLSICSSCPLGGPRSRVGWGWRPLSTWPLPGRFSQHERLDGTRQVPVRRSPESSIPSTDERNPMPRLEPLPVGAAPELKEIFEKQLASGAYVANSQLIMQRRPKMVLALRGLSQAVFDAGGTVSIAFKRLLAYVVARTHGCHY